MDILLAPLLLRRCTILDEDEPFCQHPRSPARIRAIEGNFHGDFLLTSGKKTLRWQAGDFRRRCRVDTHHPTPEGFAAPQRTRFEGIDPDVHSTSDAHA